MRRTFGGAVLVVAVLFGAANATANHRTVDLVSVGPNGTNVTSFEFAGASDDGRYVWFTTPEALVTEDADGLCTRFDYSLSPCVDVYQRDRVTGTTTLVSTGTNGNGHYDAKFAGATPDGTHVYFETGEALVAEDTDGGCPGVETTGCPDIYERVGGQTKLVSTGPADSNFGDEVRFNFVSPDGSRVYFGTTARLVAADADSCGYYQDCHDAYVRSGGTTTLISQGPSDTHQFFSQTLAVSDDGHFALFVSAENMSPEDADVCEGATKLEGCLDLYLRNLESGTTTLISTGPRANQGSFDVFGTKASADLRYVFFSTAEALTDDDLDSGRDVYRRDVQTGTTILVSGPKKTVPNPDPGFSYDVDFLHYVTPDGQRVFFSTFEQLVDADVDRNADVYEWSNGTTRLVSTTAAPRQQSKDVSFSGSSREGEQVFLATTERMLASDLDDVTDLYRASGGTIEQVSKGPTGGNGNAEVTAAPYPGAGVPSTDGSTVFFETSESLVPDDTDTQLDAYEWHNAETKLIFDGTPTPSYIVLLGQTPDARHVFLRTPDALASEDGDTTDDIYAATLNQPPSCSGVVASRASLIPANNHFRGIRISGATDPDGDSITLEITGITQDEPVGRRPDAVRSSSPDTVSLRAERNNRGDGRVYRIAFKASDGTGECEGIVRIEVRRKKNRAAVDSAPPSFNSFGT